MKRIRVPDGLWIKCNSCNEIIYRREVERNLNVCPKCNYHFRLSAREWIELVCDKESFQEFDATLESTDPLNFKDRLRYRDRLKEAQKNTKLKDAVLCGEGRIDGVSAILGILDFNFMGGSMGLVVGEKITRAVEAAGQRNLPLVIFSSSGGARMQEGIYSLMQMAKVSAALKLLKEKRVPYISVLTDPTTGGVAASFAMLGDIIIAEPKSLIGFAGPRVIEETIGQKLPQGFQRAEFALEHGLIDLIVDRKNLKKTLASLLKMLLSA